MSERRDPIPVFVRDGVLEVYGHLQRREYDKLVELTRGIRIPAPDIAQRLDVEYRAQIVPFDPHKFWEATMVHRRQFQRENTNCWHVHFPLWLAGEGGSDVFVSLTLELMEDGTVRYELDDIHPM